MGTILWENSLAICIKNPQNAHVFDLVILLDVGNYPECKYIYIWISV